MKKSPSYIVKHFIQWILCLMILGFVIGCAVNPATNRSELMLVSEDEEFEIGRQVDKQVREQMGLYLELPKLRSEVKSLIETLGQKSDRPTLIYRVEIIDTPDFNAFAVPGGFLYVHRGLLEKINTMDDLAAVLGHEIAHVAARHSAAQISKMQLLNYGLFGVAVATGGASQSYGQLIDLGAILSFSKFSRDDEREADHFGTVYMADAGFNPKAAINVMKQIDRLHTREPSTLDVWFMTHPPTKERIENLTREIERFSIEQASVLERKLQRNNYIRLLDGMAVGQWNGKELVKEDRYYNKEFLFSLPIPQEWRVQINNNNSTAVFVREKIKSFALLNIEPMQNKTSTGAFFKDLSKRLKSKGFRAGAPVSGYDHLPHGAMIGLFKSGQRSAQLMAFVKGDSGFSILCISPTEHFNDTRPQFDYMIKGLAFLTSEKAARLSPPRLKVHEVTAGDTWEKIISTYFETAHNPKRLAEYNGLSDKIPPPPGVLLKIPPSLRFR